MALTQKEIIEFEEINRNVIRLYLEGTFMKAYERSAFAFCTRVKDFKVLRKESKTLGRDILYVGFPAAAVEATLSGCMTRHIDEKTPVYKIGYDILSQIILISKNISKNCQNPFGIRMKDISYKCCFIMRGLYDVKGEARVKAIDVALPLYEELSFLLQLMKDCKEISLNSFALLSEQIQSVSRQLSILQRKVKAEVPAE